MDPIETAADIFELLEESGSQEVENNPRLLHELQLHFQRLGPRYALYVTKDTVRDVLLHKNLLVSAKDPDHQPAFGVRYMRNDVSRKQDDLLLPVHEVIFCLVNQPRILGQLLQLLYEINLNIRIARVFSTIDGYSLVIFEVDGWHLENTEDLQNEMENAIIRNKVSWSGSESYQLALADLLQAETTFGNWEIDRRQLRIKERMAPGSFGLLYHGLYNLQNVVVRVLGSRHLNGIGKAEFGQQVDRLRGLQHENVVRFVGACTWSPDICMVAEHITGYSLLHLVKGDGYRLTLSGIVGHALDICEGMEYLHENNVIHGNLCLKYLLPEYINVLNPEQFGKQADVFEFGSVLVQLVRCQEPHPHHWSPAVLDRVHSIVESLNDLIENCRADNPAIRPSFSEIRITLQDLENEVQDLN